MMHLTEEEMIGQAYGEGENAVAVGRHLEDCRECAEAFADLNRDLADVNRVDAPERDALYGERVWAAIANSLPVYAREKQRWWSSGLYRGLSLAAACGLLAGCAFYAGRVWEQHKQPQTAAQKQAAAPQQNKQQPIVVVVLDDHLDRSERFLVELKHADLDSSAMASPMRDEARSLLAANRVCRKNAAKSGDPELTTALDHLDSLLADAANEPGGLNAQTIARLQEEMNRDGVLFEVRVLRSRVTHRAGAEGSPAKGGTI
jgi:hypothetical protein